MIPIHIFFTILRLFITDINALINGSISTPYLLIFYKCMCYTCIAQKPSHLDCLRNLLGYITFIRFPLPDNISLDDKFSI